MEIRPALPEDADAIWDILEPVVRSGEFYAFPTDIARDEMLAFWHAADNRVFLAREGGRVLGTYFIRPNQRGGGSHVANCGYATAARAMGRGVARAMCQHSLEHARECGFRAMQFNFVISSNDRAVRLWHSFGFETVGRLPEAFLHPSLGFVDVFVMYRAL